MPPEPSDHDLLQRHLGGDRAAIDALIRRHIHMIYAAAHRMAGESRAPDITQAVCLLLVQKARSLAARQSIAGWLYRVAGYCAANLKKTEARRQKHEREAAMSAATSPAAEPELLPLLDAALARLSDSERNAVLLHHLEQKSHVETARHLGISEDAARKRADRGLDRLRRHFTRLGYTTTSCALTGVLSTQSSTRAPAALLHASLAAAHSAAVPATLVGMTKAASTALWLAPAKLLAACLLLAVALVTITLRGFRNSPHSPPTTLTAISAPTTAPEPLKPLPPPPEVIDISQLPAFDNLRYTHVTVDFDNATPADAARIFAQAIDAGVDLDDSALLAAGTPLAPLTLHLHDVPLLHALFQFARITQSTPTELTAAHLTYHSAIADAATPQPYMGLWTVAGPFAIELAQMEKSTNPAETLLTLNLFAEPAKRILKYPDTITLEKFTDDKGQDIQIARPRGANKRLTIPLTLPASPGRKIATLRGTATFTLPGISERLQTTAPDDHVQGHAGDLDVELLPMTHRTQPGATLPLFDMKVRYRRGRMEPRDWTALIPSLSLTPPKVFDADGHSISSHYVSSSLVKEGDDAVVLTFASPGAPPNAPRGAVTNGDPHHYDLEISLGTRAIPVPFNFSNIPLP